MQFFNNKTEIKLMWAKMIYAFAFIVLNIFKRIAGFNIWHSWSILFGIAIIIIQIIFLSIVCKKAEEIDDVDTLGAWITFALLTALECLISNLNATFFKEQKVLAVVFVAVSALVSAAFVVYLIVVERKIKKHKKEQENQKENQ